MFFCFERSETAACFGGIANVSNFVKHFVHKTGFGPVWRIARTATPRYSLKIKISRSVRKARKVFKMSWIRQNACVSLFSKGNKTKHKKEENISQRYNVLKEESNIN